jgi:hypothetical protein
MLPVVVHVQTRIESPRVPRHSTAFEMPRGPFIGNKILCRNVRFFYINYDNMNINNTFFGIK